MQTSVIFCPFHSVFGVRWKWLIYVIISLNLLWCSHIILASHQELVCFSNCNMANYYHPHTLQMENKCIEISMQECLLLWEIQHKGWTLWFLSVCRNAYVVSLAAKHLEVFNISIQILRHNKKSKGAGLSICPLKIQQFFKTHTQSFRSGT